MSAIGTEIRPSTAERRAMQQIATERGRLAVVAADHGQPLVDMFDELRHQYLISFEPGEREGWHPLEIRAHKNDLIVRARGGYMAGRLRPS